MTRRRLLVHAALALLVVATVSVRGVAPAEAQSTAPTLQSAWVDGVTLKLIYSRGLNGGSEPAGTDYAVSVGGSARAVDDVSVDRPRVTLTLSSAAVAGDTVLVSYTPGTNPVEGLSGNNVASLTNKSVANYTDLCENGTVIADHADHPELVADCNLLWGMYETIEGDSSTRKLLNWNGTNGLSSWDGITIGNVGDPPKKRVTKLILEAHDGSKALTGRLPGALGSLTGLVQITIHYHQIGGQIPPELGDLPRLVTLKLSYNNLSSRIPSEIGKLKDTLQHLDLGGNNLGGDIPSEIWELTELRTLRLHANRNKDGGPGLTGTIPAEVKNLTKLQLLYLHGNRFSGSIPPEIAQLSEVYSLSLYKNGFSGGIPPALGNMPKLQDLDLRDNLLTGTIPMSLERLLPELNTLNLGGNNLTGCIPARLLEVTTNDLQYLVDEGLMPLCGSNANSSPTISSATVNGDMLVLTYGETLDAGSRPAAGDYTVSVNGSTTEVTVSSVALSGSRITLTLSSAVVAGDVVLVNYTRGTNPVQDSGGARAANLVDYAVTNNTPPDPPVYNDDGVVDGDTLTLTYDEALDEDSTPSTSVYTVTADSTTTHTVSLVEISGATVTLTLATPVQGGQTVRLSYDPSQATDPLQDESGEDAAQLTNELIDNITDMPPMLDDAEVDGDTLTLTYNEPLDDTSDPAVAAYTVTVDTVDRGVTSAVIDGSTVTMTLASAVVGGETVLVSYDSSQATNDVQDEDSTAAADFTDEVVTNITNNAPVFTTTSFTIAENTQSVGTVAADDVDTQDSVRGYLLKEADPLDDGQMFSITNGGVLAFKLTAGADYEHSGAVGGGDTYSATIMATSGTGTRERMSELHTVTITITNAEEDGRLLFSSEQPQVGTALQATVDDPDGSESITTWTWEISPDQNTWTALTHQTTQGSLSASYAPVAVDVGKYIRVTADYTDAVPGADQVQRTLTNTVRAEPSSNAAPTFPSTETGQRSIPENTAPNVNIGHPVTATDADSDLLTYSLGGADADSFEIVTLTGQLRTLAPLDFETKDTYTVTVIAKDPSLAMAEITVTITVTDIEPEDWANPEDGGGEGGGFTPIIGGGGGGGGTPRPSDEDFEWNVTGDFDLAPGNDEPTGLWGDHVTLWVGQNGSGAEDSIFAYDLWTRQHDADLDLELHETNRAPRGIWSEGETMWVSDSGQDHLFAYAMDDGARVEDREFALNSNNGDARGIWSDGTTLWVIDSGDDSLFTYDLATGRHIGEWDLHSDNGNPQGIWSDGVAIWVSDDGARKIFSYHRRGQGLVRVADEDFDELQTAGNNSPRGIWSDGELMYVVDANDDKVYTYNMPDAIDTRLASLTLSQVDIGAFASYRMEYTGVPDAGATETTVEAVPVHHRAAVSIEPPDALGNTDGHQALLPGDPLVTVTVRSGDRTRTRDYTVQIVSSVPAPEECFRGLVNFRFSLVTFRGGTVDDLRDCAEQHNLLALYVHEDGRWVSMIIGAPAYVNRAFEEFFADDVPPRTPMIVQRNWARPQSVFTNRRAPAQVQTQPPVAPSEDCLRGFVDYRFSLVTYEGGTIPDLKACAEHHNVLALYVTEGSEWFSLIIGAPELVNRDFVELFAAGVPALTPMVAQLNLPRPQSVFTRPRTPVEPTPAESASRVETTTEEETPALDEETVVTEASAVTAPVATADVIANTGGDGVALRDDCAAGARIPGVAGWRDGTVVELLGEGRGRCDGWLWVQADDATSWVREQYVDRVSEDSAMPLAATGWAIGNTGGDGVSHRDACAVGARLAEVGGWADGVAVDLIAEGRGPCAGWLWVESGNVISWVDEQYIVEATELPEPAAEQQAEETPEAVQEEETAQEEDVVEESEPAPATETTEDEQPTPETSDDESEQTEAVAATTAEPALEGEWVIANTGGHGVSHRTACRDDARVSDVGGWPDGTEVELIEEGTGNCADWVRVRANGITSWVRNLYVVSSTADSQSMVGSRWIIGNTDGEGVSHREDCIDDARVAATGGWPDGTVVTASAAGEGQCAGWLWVEAADGVTSWVREEYLVESLGPAFPRTGGGPFE